MTDVIVAPGPTIVRRPAGERDVITAAGRTIVTRGTDRNVITRTAAERITITAAGVQGPPGPQGPPGADGSGSTTGFTVTAGFNIPAYHLVVPRLIEGTVRLADNSFLSHMSRPIWLALTSALAGETFQVIALGMVTNPSWTWAQAPIYLGENGELTQTPPTVPGASFSAQVGYAVGPTSMYFERTAPIQLI